MGNCALKARRTSIHSFSRSTRWYQMKQTSSSSYARQDSRCDLEDSAELGRSGLRAIDGLERHELLSSKQASDRIEGVLAWLERLYRSRIPVVTASYGFRRLPTALPPDPRAMNGLPSTLLWFSCSRLNMVRQAHSRIVALYYQRYYSRVTELLLVRRQEARALFITTIACGTAQQLSRKIVPSRGSGSPIFLLRTNIEKARLDAVHWIRWFHRAARLAIHPGPNFPHCRGLFTSINELRCPFPGFGRKVEK